ncbi:MAG: BsuBI/PstI family type II restriction endonuclease [Pseudotabrizicola sp.]|uniref:BsuBI/PstI family type II restriction endonuclease n=1 Tax=Pseudotabrizicola sp. TaxID=2939647 RepID=UPI002731A380|nr:BsuBI/PstI family type II restriction endonuclease [Pseudotabrizicola sp.]MDP2083547.1 BsuBI/PstI family type II restriction endonuclease [Pseudotabrizicola sp.]MDZ7574855.1 BsuBI/PstI family type II restriction endonuclease [Pseudotabrizicola sp.]
MSLPHVLSWPEIHARLPVIFPDGSANREHCIWEIAAKTIFVMAYVGAVEGLSVWIRPDQVTRMTDDQAAKLDAEARGAWAKESMKPSKADVPGRWYAVNTRESIRDDTIRYALIQNGAVIDKPGLSTTSPAGRYALQAEFADLLAPDIDEATFIAKASAWRGKHLNAGALARIAIVRRGAAGGGQYELVTFPNGETRRLTTGPSADISKAVIEVFAPKFLEKPGVISLSESGNKVVARDDELAKAIGLVIPADKNLPDIVLVDLGPSHPLLVFVEVVHTDGPVNDTRRTALLLIAEGAGFPPQHVAFVTAFLDRASPAFRKTVSSLAWGSYAWFASEPDCLVVFSGSPLQIKGG